MMGALASRMEALFRRGSNNALMSLSGTLACLLVVLPCAALAGGLAWAAQVYADPRAAWFVSAIIIWICVAPRSLEEHALRVAVPLAKGDLEGARKAVSMMVGRNPDRLDAHGVARACVESVGENLTDGASAFSSSGIREPRALPCCTAPPTCLMHSGAKRTKNTSDSARSRLVSTTR